MNVLSCRVQLYILVNYRQLASFYSRTRTHVYTQFGYHPGRILVINFGNY